MMLTLRKLDVSLGPFLNDGARIMFLMFATVASIIFLAYQSSAVRYRYSLDYGEAPLVDQAMRLASGQNIYRADISQPPYTISNYPPLYVALLSISVKLFGPAATFFVGRMISVLCALISSLCLARIVHVSTSDRFAALSAGLTFLAFPFVVFWSSLLRIDMLALALSLGGLCLLAGVTNSLRTFIAASLLLVAAIYTRQSYALAAPLAAFVWLLSRDWRQALCLTALVGGLTVLLFFLLNAFTHGGFYFNIVTANINEFKLDQLIYNWDRLRTAALIPICFGIVSLFLIRPWNPLWALSAPYLIGATLSALTIGKIGSNVNYLLELCAALSLATGVVIAWSRMHLSVQALRAAFLITMALGVAKMMRAMLNDYAWDLHERLAATKDLSRLEAFVAETPGLILADEYMGMLTLQGRPLVIQPFEVTQLARAGKWDQTPFLESIKKKEFASIILYDRPWSNERWTPEMVTAISQSYILVDIVADNKIYKAFERTPTQSIDVCPAVTWRLPSDGSLGVQSSEGGIDFFGHGNEGSIPVYAVADGLLTRRPEWVDAVAILHDDPLRPREKIWAFYGGMAAANGADSYVAKDFPQGTKNFPVKSGQLLGYQGSWSGVPLWGTWLHTFFAVLDASGKNTFPENITGNVLNPAPYLGINIESGNKNPQALKCERP
jgi:Dolichyl-phosphate-mannose-protein mannosyltransferase